MHPKYPKMFTPIQLGPVEIPNRFYLSPHASPLVDARGGPSDDYINYKMERVKGGTGLLIVSMSALERSRFVQPTCFPPETVPALKVLCDQVHAEGGRIFGELWYWWGAAGPWGPLSPPAPSMGASQTQYNLFGNRTTTREMTKDEIHRMQATFKQAAENLRDAGFDGIMLHGSHGAVPEQFLSPYFNRRADEYGGSLDNRLRFTMEILKSLREVAGSTMAVGMRLNCDELIEGGYHTKDAYQILKKIADSGFIDFADLDVAVEPDQYHIGMPPVFVDPQSYRPFVEAVRSAAGDLPVLSVLGRLTSIADGEAVLQAGVCDMVGAARALIAEPELVKNAKEGNEDRNRTCIACNWCMASLYFDGAQNCTINPASWREGHWGVDTFTPATNKVKLIVVGGGPAGLEAARVGAMRGHDVTLYEARDCLGGAMTLWSRLPARAFYNKSVEWWERELKRLGVTIQLGQRVTSAEILAAKPDAVIVATGAVYSAEGRSNHRDAQLPGHDSPLVHLPEGILLGGARPKGKVIILDGDGLHTGTGIAEMLAAEGAQVEVISPMLALMALRVTATQDTPYILKRIKQLGVKITTTSYIRGVGDREVVVYDVHTEEEHTISDVDAVVLATGRLSVNQLERELDGKVAQLFTVGDAASARMWATASYEGQKFARYVGEPDRPSTIGEAYFTPMTAEP